ncbi:acetate--CoA ligase family protein [Roseobacter sp.]|uniref:acetate--CoA ligase family protein n=1 Tax=Roseobacter sp. TaxID=1907202 RepID=UPI003298A6C1
MAPEDESADLSRLLHPRSIAVVGGGAWCANVVRAARAQGFNGPIWRVHPDPAPVDGIVAVASVEDLPQPPDATFIGVNRQATVDVVAQLSLAGAGGAVCFASGFSEAANEDAGAKALQARLVAAAGDMPILGPNCYGFINALDGALLWPDQHGCSPVDRGVAILTQSSNIAVNLTMQRRGLPIAFVVCCGNMAQTRQAQIAASLLDDPRVTAIGLHIEGFDQVPEWHALAMKAKARGIPLIALKVGASEHAQQAALSHSASLAGSDAGAGALLARLGIARVHDLPTFVETLKMLHCVGRLASPTLASISCSGGEASLIADAVKGTGLSFPPLKSGQTQALRHALGPQVALSNPLDYHTYVWGDAEKMAAAWVPMAAAHIGLVLIIVDYPHTGAGQWRCATDAAIQVRARGDCLVAVVSTLPELMPCDVAAELMAAGVVPIGGLREAIAAAEVAAHQLQPHAEPPLVAGTPRYVQMLSEAEAKALLAVHNVQIPNHVVCNTAAETVLAVCLTAPLALKGQGFAHKSEAGAVRLGLGHDALEDAARSMSANGYLIEEMVQGSVAELLVGVTIDAAHGYVLTLATGGVLTEIWQDSVSLLLPVTRHDVRDALGALKTHRVLVGFRGQPAAHIDAIVDAVMGVQSCVMAHLGQIAEVEINPLICTTTHAIAADALIRIGQTDTPRGALHEPD